MEKARQHHSELFTVRIWQEEQGSDELAWRGKVQHVTSGDARYFDDWPTLLTYLMKWLPGPQATSERD